MQMIDCVQDLRGELPRAAGVHEEYPGGHEGQDQAGGATEAGQGGPVAGRA